MSFAQRLFAPHQEAERPVLSTSCSSLHQACARGPVRNTASARHTVTSRHAVRTEAVRLHGSSAPEAKPLLVGSAQSTSRERWSIPSQDGSSDWQAPIQTAVQLGEPPVKTKPGPKDDKDAQPICYASVGDAIRTLREELPTFFSSDLSYDIYRDDIVFGDRENSFAGLGNYKACAWALRMNGNMFYQHLHVEVKRIWQLNEKELRVRWTVHGLSRFAQKYSTYDGVSVYKLDRHGKIYEHRIDNIVFPTPPALLKQFMPYVDSLVAAPARPTCPGL